jgi:hypothetical protein
MVSHKFKLEYILSLERADSLRKRHDQDIEGELQKGSLEVEVVVSSVSRETYDSG